jgi:microcystin-dependent protein
MKRAPFLGATGALLLAGCSGHHSTSSPLPGIPASSAVNPKPQSLQLVPVAAEAIPDAILTHPMIGEVRRFDGAVAPANWMLAQGQAISSSDNPQLFSILGTIAGSNLKGGFRLPNPGFGMLIAVAGTFPASPSVLAQSGRYSNSRVASLGPGATPHVRSAKKPPSAQAIAERNLAYSGVRTGRSTATRVTAQQAAGYSAAIQDARSAAIDALSPSNRARLDSAVQGAVSGRTDVYGAVAQMISSLSPSEAGALLDVNDRMTRPFSNAWTPSSRQNAQIDAAHFLISVTITREQSRTIFQHEQRSGL